MLRDCCDSQGASTVSAKGDDVWESRSSPEATVEGGKHNTYGTQGPSGTTLVACEVTVFLLKLYQYDSRKGR